MEGNISKILKILTFTISLIAVYFFVQVMVVGDEAIQAEQGAGVVGPFVVYTIGLLITIAVVTVVFSVVGLVKKPETLKKVSINIVILGIIVLVSYLLASDNIVRDSLGQILKVDGEILSEDQARSISKNVGLGIWTTFVLGILAVASIVFGSIRSIIK